MDDAAEPGADEESVSTIVRAVTGEEGRVFFTGLGDLSRATDALPATGGAAGTGEGTSWVSVARVRGKGRRPGGGAGRVRFLFCARGLVEGGRLRPAAARAVAVARVLGAFDDVECGPAAPPAAAPPPDGGPALVAEWTPPRGRVVRFPVRPCPGGGALLLSPRFHPLVGTHRVAVRVTLLWGPGLPPRFALDAGARRAPYLFRAENEVLVMTDETIGPDERPADLTFPVSVHVGDAEMTVEQLAALRPGSVLRLSHGSDLRGTLYVGGSAVSTVRVEWGPDGAAFVVTGTPGAPD